MESSEFNNTENAQHPNMIISYMLLRKIIGIIGLLLPIALVVGAYYYGNCKVVQASISDYYHTEMRNVFVGAVCAVAVFMFAYNGYDIRDKIAGSLAGVFALGIVFFPTKIDTESVCATYCFEYEDWINTFHMICAVLFFAILIYFSLKLFVLTREGLETSQKRKRNKVYKTCGYTMLVAVLLILLYIFVLRDRYPELANLRPIFWLETIALFAFGISWLTKGQLILKD